MLFMKKGEKNIADFLSRNGAESTSSSETDHIESVLHLDFVTQCHTPKAMTLSDIKSHSENDREIMAVRQALVSDRWHDNPLVSQYKNYKQELSDHNGIILREDKIVLPFSLRKRALEIVHEGHLGIQRCKELLLTESLLAFINQRRFRFYQRLCCLSSKC